MEITRDIIIDLLPLYVADEASADTKNLVSEYLQHDSELAEMARQYGTMELPEDTPVPLTKEDKMQAFKEAKRLMFLRTIILASIIAGSIIAAMLLAVLAAAFFIG